MQTLDAFKAAVNDLCLENDAEAEVFGFRREGRNAILDLRLGHVGADEFSEMWCVKCRGVLSFLISPGTCDADSVEILNDAPELWEYVHPRASLYCVGAPPGKADAVVGALYRAYRATVAEADDSLMFGRGLNALSSVPGGHGLVFEGPLPLAQAYEEALVSLGIKTSIVVGRKLTRWNGSEHVERTKGPKLLMCSPSWIIAESFTVARVERVGASREHS